MKTFSLECTALTGTNKVGKLKADESGYYKVVLGGFDIPNSSGGVYPYEDAKHIFEQSSKFMRNIAAGTQFGEWGHPKREPGQTLSNYIKRNKIIDEAKIAFHIKKVEIDFDSVKDKNGNSVVAVIGWVRGAGPNGAAFDKMLENPELNVCFSLRGSTEDVTGPGGKLIRKLVDLTTFDYVVFPGLEVAQKYHSPALESFDKVTFTEDALENIRESVYIAGLAQESGDVLDFITAHIGIAKPVANRKTFDTSYLGKRPFKSLKWK